MEYSRFRCIFAVISLITVVSPVSATVIYGHAFKKITGTRWTHTIGSAIDLALSNTMKTNVLSVAFFDNTLNSTASTASVIISNDASFIAKDSDEPSSITWQNSSDSLWPTQNSFGQMLYSEACFNKALPYFEGPSLDLDTLNLRFWRSLVDHDKWYILLDNAIDSPAEPQPLPVGVLGMGIMGVATLQQRSKIKNG